MSAPAGAERATGTHGQRPLRVLIVDPLDEGAIARLRADHKVTVSLRPPPSALLELVAEAEVLIVRSGVEITGEVIGGAPRLGLIVRAGVGTDNLDLEAARAASVRVCTVPGLSAGAVAEHAIGLMIATMRRIPEADRQVRDGIWDKRGLVGAELSGRTLGLVGLGSIGSRIAELAGALGMRLVACVARASSQRRAELAERGIDLADLDALLERSDVVSLQLPLTGESRGLIGADRLARMRPGAYLVNVSRAGIVDEAALEHALREGPLAGAATDVLEGERGRPSLASLDNVVLTPHIGAMTADSQRRIGEAVIGAITAWDRGEALQNRVC